MPSSARLEIMRRIVDAQDADILVFNAPIQRPRDSKMISRFQGRRCRPNLLLILVTNGGDPDAAYRISRCLQDRYQKFVCLVSGVCKSAGTLLLLGAHELVFSDHGEIGPLDIQMMKKDELWESESGLTVMTALTALHENAQNAFDHFLLSLTTRSGGRITVRTASEMAAKLTEALYSPIAEQIDPIHVGEVARSMAIAKNYGERLMAKGKNFDDDALGELIGSYPSHSFVIDREEACRKFKNVRICSDDESELLEDLGDAARIPLQPNGWVKFISDDLQEKPDVPTQGDAILERPAADGSPAPAAGGVLPEGQANPAAA
jgi:hypothetical protein